MLARLPGDLDAGLGLRAFHRRLETDLPGRNRCGDGRGWRGRCRCWYGMEMAARDEFGVQVCGLPAT
jgi:hypothetical protein